MNCEDFRHQLLIDPLSEDRAFREHARTCDACARAAREALAFEEELRRVLEVECSPWSPSALEPSPRRVWFKASLLMLLSLSCALLWIGTRWDGDGVAGDWEQIVLGHIREEEGTLDARGEVPRARLYLLFRSLGWDLDGKLGEVRFANRCQIGGSDGLHLVLGGERGPVTVLIMPGRSLAHTREIGSADLQGLVVPTDFGALAVVGEEGEPLAATVGRLMGRLEPARGR